ncbi:hypothetical protein B0H12DRAFT_1094983 [Mycena haematopus]|nr:hypothetical protein B0H12DRAFT_1094983 [Mycena haematopus]
MAAQEKEKGNAAFKAGDYPTAVGHYSAAIHADPADPTFPLNRAAAYLKLGKNEDAERDCSTVLTLSKRNTKALFRRAQARVELGKLSEAQEDLKEAAILEPANQSVKQELSKVAELIQQASKKADGRRSMPTPVDASNAPSSSTPKPASKPTPKPKAAESSDLMKPVSSRPLSASSSKDTASSTPPKPAAQPTPKPSSFKDAKSARDSSKPSRVAGGIFRASGESTIFTRPAPAEPVMKPAPPAKQDAPSPPSAPIPVPDVSPPAPGQKSVALPAADVKSPMSLFDFTRAWERAPDSTARFTLLSQIPPPALPALFQTSLDPALFVEIVDTLGAHISAGTDAGRERVEAYMRAFSGVPRFGTVVRLLSRAEKARVREVCGVFGRAEGEGSDGEVWAPVWR